MQHRSEHTAEWIVAVSVNIFNERLGMTAVPVDQEYEHLNLSFSSTNDYIQCMEMNTEA